jgi:hypothetical protein
MSATRGSVDAGGMRILVRASVFLAGWAVFFLLVVAGTSSAGDADIGAGLLAFLLVALGAAVWGWYDGRRLDYGTLAVTWGVVGALMGVIVPLFTGLVAGELDTDVVASDILTGMPFVAVLVAAPALLAGLLAIVLRGSPNDRG